MDDSGLLKSDPQKYYFKILCKMMYYLGMGDSWYETFGTTGIKKKLYNAWCVVANGFVVIVIFNQILAHFRTDLDDKERNNLFQFTIAQSLVFWKILTLYYRRQRIMVVMRRLLEGTRSIFYSLELERSTMRQSATYIIVMVVAVYFTLMSALFDAIRAHIKEDKPIQTEVVFYPKSSDASTFTKILRFCIELHWYYIMAMMLVVDGLMLASLKTVTYKFKIIQLYYEDLRTKLLENKKKKPLREVEEEYKKGFVTGIKMHEDALWCASNVQDSMGAIYSIQVLESVTLLVMCLIKLVAAERNFIYLLNTLAYIGCLIVLTGFYMMAAGDITYEASMVPTAMFHSGWELIRARSDFRVLAVVALQRSQVPVQMTAFGVMTLSYANFISVLRSSYSFFAVMY